MKSMWSGLMSHEVTDDVWAAVVPFLCRGVTHLDTMDGVRESIRKREAQLWVTWREKQCLSVLVTKVVKHDKGTVLVLAHCGGIDMHSWLDHLEVLEAYARAEGCIRIDIIGRPGWQRVLPGFVQTGVVLEKTL